MLFRSYDRASRGKTERMRVSTALMSGKFAPVGAKPRLLARLASFLFLILFAIASAIPDSGSPYAVGPEGDVAGETVVVSEAGDGDPVEALAQALISPSLAYRDARPGEFVEGDGGVPRSVRPDRSFEARGPPAV